MMLGLSAIPWRAIIYTGVLAASFAFGVSWQKGREAKAHLAQLQAQSIQLSKEIVRSQEISLRVTQQIELDAKRQQEIRDQVIEHLQSKLKSSQEKIHELEKLGIKRQQIVQVCSDGDLYRLDARTLGLLNSAATEDAVATTRTDEEGRALTEVGATDLIEYELTIVQMYRALAARHDALVDWITDKQKELAQ